MADNHSIHPASGNTCSILLVEDNHINQKVVSLMLSKLGLVPEIADRGEYAIERVRERAFDLILMLGEECPPIVALTADVVRGNKEDVQKQGLDGFLTKPISVDRLRECIREQTGKEFN